MAMTVKELLCELCKCSPLSEVEVREDGNGRLRKVYWAQKEESKLIITIGGYDDLDEETRS